MRILLALALGVAAAIGTTAARAEQNVCGQQIDSLMQDWNAIAFHEASKPAAMASGKGGHKHVQLELDVMKTHIRRAATYCKEGKDHEALLHLDVVRAWLKLPDIVHPAWHSVPPR